jgi:sortase A
MRLRTLLPALAPVLLALVLCLGQPARALGGRQEQAPASYPGPTLLAIPSIKLSAEVEPVGYQLTDQPLRDGSQSLGWQTAENAVGWHRSSAVPGRPGNVVMAGHNGTLGGRVFRNLHKVKVGATITVVANDMEHEYVVTDRIVLPYVFASEYRRAQIAHLLGQFGDERLTLITCYPWYTNTHRLILVAHPIDPPDRSSIE